jgi:hypothetical protein
VLARVEVEYDDTELSIVQRGAPPPYTVGSCSDDTVNLLAMSVGKMIAALVASSPSSMDSVLDEFSATVARAARGTRRD